MHGKEEKKGRGKEEKKGRKGGSIRNMLFRVKLTISNFVFMPDVFDKQII